MTSIPQPTPHPYPSHKTTPHNQKNLVRILSTLDREQPKPTLTPPP